MEDLLKGSGVEELYRGGLTKGVAFVRKAMVKTKQQNKGYKPPARYGYDFDVAKELDKPSEHIQTNIGEVPKDKVVKYQYQRRKKSEEEKRREEVHKFSYWGLTPEDFEEVDGQLIEKKHGLIWGPIFFQPAGREEGVWGLRCCRYDKKGKKIPSNKKYEFLYVKEDDPKNPEDVDNLFPNAGERWDKEQEKFVDTYDLVKADPPYEITNTNDEGDEVLLKQHFAKGRTEQRFAFGEFLKRRSRPFYWFKYFYNNQKEVGDYEELPPTAEKITYKDIPTIISANRQMRKFIDGAMNSKYYGSQMLSEQQDRWNKHLSGLQQRQRATGEKKFFARAGEPINKYRELDTKEKQEKYLREIKTKIDDLEQKIRDTPKGKRVTIRYKGALGQKLTREGRSKIESLRDTQRKYIQLYQTALEPRYYKKEIDYGVKTLSHRVGGPITYKKKTYTQRGVQQSTNTAGNNRWGEARAELALEKIDDRQTDLSNRVNTLNYVITLNEALVKKLVRNPLNLPIEEALQIRENDRDRARDPRDWDRKEQKEFMKKADDRAKKQRKNENLEGLEDDENNPPDDE